MWVLVFGLAVFLGVHSVRWVAPGWRERVIAADGEARWKIAYALVAAVGLGMTAWGYALARSHPVVLWHPGAPLRHFAAVLMLPAMVLLVAAYVPGNGLRARLGHPMLLGTKVWAFGHLLANGNLADVLLFGGLLAWSIVAFRMLRRRDAAAGIERRGAAAEAGRRGRFGWGGDAATLATLLLGFALWAWLAFAGHAWLIGVPVAAVGG